MQSLGQRPKNRLIPALAPQGVAGHGRNEAIATASRVPLAPCPNAAQHPPGLAEPAWNLNLGLIRLVFTARGPRQAQKHSVYRFRLASAQARVWHRFPQQDERQKGRYQTIGIRSGSCASRQGRAVTAHVVLLLRAQWVVIDPCRRHGACRLPVQAHGDRPSV